MLQVAELYEEAQKLTGGGQEAAAMLTLAEVLTRLSEQTFDARIELSTRQEEAWEVSVGTNPSSQDPIQVVVLGP